MNDGNQVYITLGKVTKINKYNSIYSRLEGKKRNNILRFRRLYRSKKRNNNVIPLY